MCLDRYQDRSVGEWQSVAKGVFARCPNPQPVPSSSVHSASTEAVGLFLLRTKMALALGPRGAAKRERERARGQHVGMLVMHLRGEFWCWQKRVATIP